MTKLYLHRTRHPLELAFIGSVAAAGTTLSLPGGATSGDLCIVIAYNSGSTTPPSLATGWTNLNSGVVGVSGTTSYRFARKFITTDTDIGTWTGATHVGVAVYRNAVSIAGSSFSQSGSASSAIRVFDSDVTRTANRGWQVGLWVHTTATNADAATSTHVPNSRTTGWGVGSMGMADTGGGAWGPTGVQETASVNASGAWFAGGFEIGFNNLPGEYSLSATTPTAMDPRNWVMDATIGTSAQTSIALATQAVVTAQPSLIGRWVFGSALSASTIASVASIAAAVSESNANSSFVMRAVVAIWRPSTQSLVGRITDLANVIATATTSEAWAAASTITSSPVTAVAGDLLVLELWRDSTVQGMSTAYTDTVFYDGTTEGSSANAASFIDVPVGGNRITQVAAEALVLPTSQLARVSQVAAEALVLPTSQLARVSQVAVEVLIGAPPLDNSLPRLLLGSKL